MTVTDETERRIADIANGLLTAYPPSTTPTRDFLAARFDAGLALVENPVGSGGLGVPAPLQSLADSLIAAAGGPNPRDTNRIGFGMALPTIQRHASDELKERLLRPLYIGDEQWCQLFSEPGAGSDLAGLSTMAEQHPDGHWMVRGQKVWTSLADQARWGLLLTRTHPGEVKHRGLTYFVLDMHSPAVDVRPLRQLTGDAEFNEVFIDGASVPDEYRLGDPGAGWSVAMTTLTGERNSIAKSPKRGATAIGHALELWRTRPDLRTSGLAERLVDLVNRADASKLTQLRYGGTADPSQGGARGALMKIVDSELAQHAYEFCIEMLGIEATTFPTFDEPFSKGHGDGLKWGFLRARGFTIGGGTAEVLRNVVGERGLGLPKDLSAESDKPWNEVNRG